MKRLYSALIVLLLLVYIGGLFVPIMNNNAAHHANIALHMYLTGDYLNLVDRGADYLDKPHLLFWLAALSYHLFGVTSFAYKFFSFVFALVGIYSTGQLARWVSGEQSGRYAALILASSFGFVLSVNDVRMDAMVVSCIALASWQLLEHWSTGSVRSLLISALALALGFATKGMVAIALPVFTLIFTALHQKRLKDLFTLRWGLLVILTIALILPVFYCFYVQFDLHPEKVVRGRSHNSGIWFLLVGQSVQRYTGSGWGSRAPDPFYLVHTFLWAFLPWSILAFVALGENIHSWFSKKSKVLNEKLSALAATTALTFLLISFSRFKNDHYINVLLPYFAVLTAHFLKQLSPLNYKALYHLQLVLSALLMLLIAAMNFWAFRPSVVWIGIPALIIAALFFYVSSRGDLRSRAVWLSFVAMIFSFFLLNFNFYPRLLAYQSGHVLAGKIKAAGIPPGQLYYYNTAERNYSLDFSLSALPRSLTPGELKNKTDTVYLFADQPKLDTLRASGVPFEIVLQTPHYNVTTLRLSFLNPATRYQKLDTHYILMVPNGSYP